VAEYLPFPSFQVLFQMILGGQVKISSGLHLLHDLGEAVRSSLHSGALNGAPIDGILVVGVDANGV
jgi:hypothetical protein